VADHEDASGVDVRLRAQERHCGDRVIGGFLVDRVGAGKILWPGLRAFLIAQRGDAAVGEAVQAGLAQLPPNMLDMPIEELDLPMRAYNSLKRNNIVKVGQLLQLKDDDLLRMRNFGKKSLDEMKERLRMRGFIIPETESDGLDEAAFEPEGDDEDES